MSLHYRSITIVYIINNILTFTITIYKTTYMIVDDLST